MKRHVTAVMWGRDGIVEELSIYVYYAYLKPTLLQSQDLRVGQVKELL